MAGIISALRKVSGKITGKVSPSTNTPLIVKRAKVLNDKSPFHVKEAYKALRTNVVFSVTHEGAKK